MQCVEAVFPWIFLLIGGAHLFVRNRSTSPAWFPLCEQLTESLGTVTEGDFFEIHHFRRPAPSLFENWVLSDPFGWRGYCPSVQRGYRKLNPVQKQCAG